MCTSTSCNERCGERASKPRRAYFGERKVTVDYIRSFIATIAGGIIGLQYTFFIVHVPRDDRAMTGKSHTFFYIIREDGIVQHGRYCHYYYARKRRNHGHKSKLYWKKEIRIYNIF